MNKIFYIFAGVNGAGKSTLYNSHLEDEGIKNSVRINTDEIVRGIGDWRSSVDQIRAAKIAIQRRNECFKEGKSLNEETTLTGKTILKMIDKAKILGYKIYLYYVGVKNPEIAKERVKNRVRKGGHNIPDEVIEKRYYESLENLEKIILKCDFISLYDNTEIYKEIFSVVNDEIIKKENDSIKWLETAIQKKCTQLDGKLKTQI